MNGIKGKGNICLFTFLILIGLEVSSCDSPANQVQRKKDFYYTCPMHPQVRRDGPGDCPVCGMKLVRVETGAREDTVSMDTALYYLSQPVTQTVAGSFKVIEPTLSGSLDTLTVEGWMEFDPEEAYVISPHVDGRIEKVYVKYAYQRIRAGAPLMTVYSPALLTRQRDLLQAYHERAQNLVAGITDELIHLGMNSREIKSVIDDGKPLKAITLFSPYDGFSRPADPGSGKHAEPELLHSREGMYVKAGQPLLTIQGTHQAWALLGVFASDLKYIHTGDPVVIYTDGDSQDGINGKISFIPPFRGGAEKTSQVRVYLKEIPDHWKVGTLVHGKIVVRGRSRRMFVPASAVDQLGAHSVVWVEDSVNRHIFHVRQVLTGLKNDDSIEIRSGLYPGEKIVENAGYMVDSDSFIR